jgi:hypothetical protein
MNEDAAENGLQELLGSINCAFVICGCRIALTADCGRMEADVQRSESPIASFTALFFRVRRSLAWVDMLRECTDGSKMRDTCRM